MSYTTTEELLLRFGEAELTELTDRQEEGVLDTDVLDSSISDVGAIIDGYLRGRYSLPVGANPILTGAASDMVRYSLYTDRIPEEVATRNKDAIATLKRISDGLILLDESTATPTATAAIVEAPERVFDMSTLDSY